jgi:cysteine desulfurase
MEQWINPSTSISEMIYLDYNATAPLLPAVRAAMAPYLAEEFGNPSSVHRAGARARTVVEAARRTIAEHVGARPAEVVFTSGGTESNNWALFGRVLPERRPHLVVAAVEHASVLAPARELERRGAVVTVLGVDGAGRVDPAALAAAVRPDTALVSIGWANNEIGTVQDVAELAAVCGRASVCFHVDAVQALGKIPVDAGCADLCSLSAHKLGGPKGIGALIVRRDVTLQPLFFGGPQERGRRAGTENVAAIVGFAAAVRTTAIPAEIETLRERLWAGLAEIPDVIRNSPAAGCLPNTLNVSFAGVAGEAVVAALDLEGIAVSAGSACAAGASEPSHVLRALGRDACAARDGVRFSLGAATTAAEIARTVEVVRAVIARARGATAPARAAEPGAGTHAEVEA